MGNQLRVLGFTDGVLSGGHRIADTARAARWLVVASAVLGTSLAACQTFVGLGGPGRASLAAGVRAFPRGSDALDSIGRLDLLKRLGVGALFWAVLICGLGAALAMSYGRRRSDGRHVRGSRLGTGSSRAIVASPVLALVLVSGSWLLLASPMERRHVIDYAVSTVSGHSALASRVFGRVGDPASRWYSMGDHAGYYRHSVVRTFLGDRVYGRPVSAMLLRFLGAWIAGSIMMGLALRALQSRTQPKSTIPIADHHLPESSETSHVLLVGATGSGKTMAMNAIVSSLRERGDPAVVLDIGGDYVSRFYRPETDLILNPRDTRGASWNLAAEVRSGDDYHRYAKSLYPSPVSAEPFWTEAAACVFAWSARSLAEEGRPDLGSLYKFLTCEPLDGVHKRLSGTPAGRFTDPAGGEMPRSVLASVGTKLQAISEQRGSADAVSLRDWVGSPGSGIVFITASEEDLPTLRPLMSLWLEVLAQAALSLEPSPTRRLWFLLDEIAAMQRLPALEPLLVRGRKFGASCVLGLQSVAQMRDRYGRDVAKTLLGQPQTQLVLRTSEADTARWLEAQLGQREVRESKASQSVGGHMSTGYQEQLRGEATVLASELMELPSLEGYLRMPGLGSLARARVPIRDYPRVHSSFERIYREVA